MACDGIRFIKMEGAGNDYVYLNLVDEELDCDFGMLAREISDRRYGVGGDGLILLERKKTAEADVGMRIFNADGSEAEMCGNGIRCLAWLAYTERAVAEFPVRVATRGGLREVDAVWGGAGEMRGMRVEMGGGRYGRDFGWVRSEYLRADGRERVMLTSGDGSWRGMLVDVGNPHLVLFVDEQDDSRAVIEGDGWREVGATLERHEAFPERINVHFVEVIHRGRARVRHWERGSGATLACGTGACAVAVAGVITGRMDVAIEVACPGGELEIAWDRARNLLTKTGPAREVFRGVWRGSREQENVEMAGVTGSSLRA